MLVLVLVSIGVGVGAGVGAGAAAACMVVVLLLTGVSVGTCRLCMEASACMGWCCCVARLILTDFLILVAVLAVCVL